MICKGERRSEPEFKYSVVEKVWFEADSYPVSTEMEEVKEIFYHSASGEGDRHYVDVVFKNGFIERHFEFNTIRLKENEA